MLLYVIRRAIWEYRMYAYGYQIRRLNNMVIAMETKREKEMKKFERFKKATKSNRSKMARYINTTRWIFKSESSNKGSFFFREKMYPLMKGVIHMQKRVHQTNEEEKKRFVDMVGRTILYIEEQRSLYDMANKLNLYSWQVNYNIDELLYQLRKHLGWKRYIKALFIRKDWGFGLFLFFAKFTYDIMRENKREILKAKL